MCVAPPTLQVLLINAVKDVAAALGDLISATKYASGKPPKDPAMTTLMDSAKVGESPTDALVNVHDVGVGLLTFLLTFISV